MRHAELLTDRILFLEGLPNYQRLFPLHIGQTLQEMFQADMEIKVAAVKRLCDGAAHMREVGEITSTRLFNEILCRRGAPHRLSQDPAFTAGQAGRAAVRRPTGRRSGARRHRPAPGYGSRPISRCPWRIFPASGAPRPAMSSRATRLKALAEVRAVRHAIASLLRLDLTIGCP
jgi:Ferritin-like domain